LTLNLEAQRTAAKSPFKIFQALTAARKTDSIKKGSLQHQVLSEHVFAFTREYPGSLGYLVLVNTDYIDSQVDAKSTFIQLPDEGVVYISSLDSTLEVA